MPAMGSSSSNSEASSDKAIASSSWRFSPWASSETRTWARPPRPTRSSASLAGWRSCGRRRAFFHRLKPPGLCACTAMATLSSALKAG
jgi:hypothetical protein